MISATQCTGADFCEEISGATDTAFNHFYEGNPPSRRVHSTENFEIMVDMSPLTIGHLLLLPKKHYLSFAQVLGAYSDETEGLLERVVALYTETFQRQPLIMEHGSGADQESHACITHAHLHLLPVDGTAMDDLLLRDDLAYKDLESITELAMSPWPESNYFLRFFDRRCRVYLPTVRQKRQYLRSVAGAILSIEDPEWDYAVVMRKEDLRSTMKMVAHWSDRLSHSHSIPGA
ncbi:HIT family protein [Actinosynnema sp. NPDC004786]